MKNVYLVHGWTYSLEKYLALKSELEKIGINIILLKVPGLTEPSTKVWTIEDYVEWLRDQLKSEKNPIVIAHSNGGRITMSYIDKYPGHIKKLILIDSAGVPHNEKRSVVKLKTLKTLAKVGKIVEFVPGLKRMFYRVIGATDYLNAPENMKLTMRNMLAADNSIDPSKVSIPTLIIWGREDTQTPLSDGNKLHEQISGSKMIVIDDARHAPHATQPKLVAKYIAEELK